MTQNTAATAYTAPAPMAWPVRLLAMLLLVFLLVFPKGGIKAGDIPITWGYILMVAAAGIGLFGLLAKGGLSRKAANACLLTLPFSILSILVINANTYYSAGYFYSFIATFLAIPFFFLICFHNYLKAADMPRLIHFINMSVLVVSVYGIFLFFFRIKFGYFIEVPYLTVNLADVGMLDNKHIDRGDGIFKLISTYNNGNIFGACMLMLLPLFCATRPTWQQIIVKGALVLTLSRTVWIGLMVYQLLLPLFSGEPRPLRKIIKSVVFVALIGAGILVALTVMGKDVGFLFDQNLGGRINQVEAISDLEFIATQPFVALTEMVYLSILHALGILPFLLYLVWLTAPLVAHITSTSAGTRHPVKRQLALGLLIYMVISASDGAILLIPVMAIYWGVAALLLSDNPWFQQPFAPWAKKAAGRAGGRALPAISAAPNPHKPGMPTNPSSAPRR